jgi:hypothetical protein
MLINDLITAYRTDVDSPYCKPMGLRFHTRGHYDSLCKRIAADIGALDLADIKARQLLHWHETFIAAEKVSMGHAVIGQLRILVGFGSTILDDPDCVKVSGLLSNMRFIMAKPRSEQLTAEQAIRIRAGAHAANRRSIALAQAIQFDLMFRQKDVIGEYVPETEPGESDTFDMDQKWLRGIRWEEIDSNFILSHVTSKRQKLAVWDLKLAGMVMQELILGYGAMDRSRMPATGPVIICETTSLPWSSIEFRRVWRKIADSVGIPKTVRNMDSRAGAITEALQAGALPEQVRKAATHSNFSTTQNYSRDDTTATAEVSRARSASRNKLGDNTG